MSESTPAPSFQTAQAARVEPRAVALFNWFIQKSGLSRRRISAKTLPSIYPWNGMVKVWVGVGLGVTELGTTSKICIRMS